MTRTITHRPLRDERDFWRMRQLLIDAFPMTPIGFNWDVRHLDGQRFHTHRGDMSHLLRHPIELWEDGDRLVAFVLVEGSHDANPQVHPDYRFLEDELIAWSVVHLAAPIAGDPSADASSADASSADAPNRRQTTVYCYEYDALRQATLAAHGFARMEYGGMYRHLRLGCQPRPQVELAQGYTLRTTQPADAANCQRIADLLNAAFNRNFHTGQEFRNFTLGAPCYDPELDLVAVAPDGSFAAYVGIAYDEANQLGVFEPVCTHPDHQRKGLARALMNEGLLRLWDRGAVHATVDTGDMVAANALYTAMGFSEAYKGYVWKKVL